MTFGASDCIINVKVGLPSRVRVREPRVFGLERHLMVSRYKW